MPDAPSNYDEALRLRQAHKDLTEAYQVTAENRLVRLDADQWRAAVFAQRDREALLAAAQVHATLAVADELKAKRQQERVQWGKSL